MATGPYTNMKRHSSAHTHVARPHSLRSIYTKCLVTLALVSLTIYVLTYLTPSGISTNTGLVFQPIQWNITRDPSEVRIAKAAILYDSHSNAIWTKALELHQAQGYEVHVLRKEIVKGFADQYLWLHEIIVKELRKKSEVQAEWILYISPLPPPSFHLLANTPNSFFDLPSVLLINPSLSLQTFLPPLPSIDSESYKALSIITTKPDSEHINSNLLFLRVSGLTVRILTLALAAPFTEPGRQWGKDVSASTLQYVLEEEKYGMRDKVVYQPAEWYNETSAVFTQIWGESQVLQLLEVEKELRRISEQKTTSEPYPNKAEIDTFWARVTEAKRMLNEARDRGHTEQEGEFQEEIRWLKYAVEARAWDAEGLREAVERLKARLGIGQVIGFESVYK